MSHGDLKMAESYGMYVLSNLSKDTCLSCDCLHPDEFTSQDGGGQHGYYLKKSVDLFF